MVKLVPCNNDILNEVTVIYNNNNNLFIIPEIHQSGYRTCQ